MSSEDVYGVSEVFSEYGSHLEAETVKKEELKVVIRLICPVPVRRILTC